jgi:hypothetical protein
MISLRCRSKSLALSLALGSANPYACAAFPDTNAAKQYATHVEQSCAAFVDSWTKRPEMAALQAARKLEHQVICGCAKERLSSDLRLRAQLQLSDEEFGQRIQRDPLRSYMLNRILQSTLACFSAEMNTSLEAMDLAK